MRTRPEEGIDLIEIVPNANPPVARLMSWDKYRYLQEKAVKKERLAQKAAGLKQIQISARAAGHDMETKAKQLNQFLADGHSVEIVLRLRGREKANRDWAFQKLDQFIKLITAEYKTINPPKTGGHGVVVQIVPKK